MDPNITPRGTPLHSYSPLVFRVSVTWCVLFKDRHCPLKQLRGGGVRPIGQMETSAQLVCDKAAHKTQVLRCVYSGTESLAGQVCV